MSMDDDLRQDGMFSQILKRITSLEAFEREFRLKQFGAGAGYTEGARVYNSADINVNDTTETFLTFDTELWDTDTIHDGVNPGRLTCQTAGKYVITAQVSMAITSGKFMAVYILYNGLDYIAINNIHGSFSGNAHCVCTTQFDMAVGDYVEVSVYQNTGGAINALYLPVYSPQFMMQRIG